MKEVSYCPMVIGALVVEISLGFLEARPWRM
jgi:hypothetical protein